MNLGVIGTFYNRHQNSLPLFKRLVLDLTMQPHEVWLMCETQADVEALREAYTDLYELELLEKWPAHVQMVELPTPRDGDAYAVLPYAHKINWALDHLTSDAVVYVDNNSMPGPDKYRVMLDALEENPGWGAVYCTQKRTGFNDLVSTAEQPVMDAFCNLNYTQVMHRLTADRWPTDMSLANPDLADGYFWRELHKRIGAFYPAGGSFIHDDHHIPSPAAAL